MHWQTEISQARTGGTQGKDSLLVFRWRKQNPLFVETENLFCGNRKTPFVETENDDGIDRMNDEKATGIGQETAGGVRVHVVDDNRASRESLYLYLRSQGYDVAKHASAAEFLAAVDKTEEACLITDLKMPGMSGLELQEELVRRGNEIPVIVVSGFADVPSAVRAMQNGAVTLLEKPYREEDLFSAVKESVRRVREERQARERRREVEGKLESLSEGEREIMDFLLQGVSNKTIANKLDYGLRTVERRRHILLQKMGVASLPELATMVSGADIKSDTACQS